MKYDEDLLVELIADGELSHGEIAEQVGASRRTVWSIANGRSRPDLQQEIADTVEGYRQATIRLAAKHMQPLLLKQIKVALEGQGETARKAREFLLKNFMQALADQPAEAVEKRRARLAEKQEIKLDEYYERQLQRERDNDISTWTEEDWGDPADDDGWIRDDTDDDGAESDECGMMNDETATDRRHDPASVEHTQAETSNTDDEDSSGMTGPDVAGEDASVEKKKKKNKEKSDPYNGEYPIAAWRRSMQDARLAALLGMD